MPKTNEELEQELIQCQRDQATQTTAVAQLQATLSTLSERLQDNPENRALREEVNQLREQLTARSTELEETTASLKAMRDQFAQSALGAVTRTDATVTAVVKDVVKPAPTQANRRKPAFL